MVRLRRENQEQLVEAIASLISVQVKGDQLINYNPDEYQINIDN